MYSIKTDLGVSGSATVQKDLDIKGNAVIRNNLSVLGTVSFADATFTAITVTDTATMKDVSVSGTATVKDLDVSGNTTLGSTASDIIQVNGVSTFNAPVSFGANVTQTTGTATLLDTTLSTLEVTGDSTLNGDLAMKPNSTATLGDTSVQNLTVNGNQTIAGTAAVTGKLTVQDIEINGTVTGTFSTETGSFKNITVEETSTLKTVNISGNTTIAAGQNITGLTSTATFGTVTLNGQGASVNFNYSDTSNPSWIRSAIQPYKIASHEFQGDVGNIIQFTTGRDADAAGTQGLRSLGKATMDYVAIRGNNTIGTTQPQLSVAGTSVFSGKTTVGDLEITGAVSGLAFSDIVADSVTAPVGTFDTKVTVKDLVVTGTTTGVSANVDGTAIAPSSVVSTGAVSGTNVSSTGTMTVGTNLSVANGLATVKDLTVTGTLTANITANVDGEDILPKSIVVTEDVQVGTTLVVGSNASVSNGTLTVKDLVVTGTTTGVTVTANVDGLNIAPASVAATGEVKGATLASTGSGSIGTNLTVGNNLNVTGTLTAGSIDLGSSDLSINSLTTATGVSVGGNLSVSNNLSITGNVVGVLKTVNITNSDTISTPRLTVSDFAAIETVQTTSIRATPTNNGTVAVRSDLRADKSLTVNGVLTPVGGLDLSKTAISALSLDTTGNAHVGGNLTVDGTFDLSATNLSAASMSTSGNTSVGGDLSVTGNITGAAKFANTVNVTGATTLNSLSVVGPITKSGTGALAFGSNVNMNNDLTVQGVFTPAGGLDISTSDLQVNSLSTTAGVTAGSTLAVTTNATVGGTLGVTGKSTLKDTEVSTFKATAASTLASVTSTAITNSGRTSTGQLQVGTGTFDTAYATNVFGNAIVNGNLTITGTINGTIDMSDKDINPRNITASGTLTVSGVSTFRDKITATNMEVGATGSNLNNMVVNGNVKATGDFEVGGVIKGTLDQSGSAVKVGSLETMLAAGIKIGVNGPLVLGSGGIITGAPVISGNTSVGGTFTSTGLATLNGGVKVVGNSDLATVSTSGLATLDSLKVTNLSTVKDLIITGTLNTNIANLVTSSVTTKRYSVTPTNVATPITGTWSPDGTSNVYNVSVSGPVTIGPMNNPGGGAGSWFIYITNTAGAAISVDSSLGIVAGSFSNVAGSVTIMQVVYCGVGTLYDVFLAQRN